MVTLRWVPQIPLRRILVFKKPWWQPLPREVTALQPLSLKRQQRHDFIQALHQRSGQAVSAEELLSFVGRLWASPAYHRPTPVARRLRASAVSDSLAVSVEAFAGRATREVVSGWNAVYRSLHSIRPPRLYRRARKDVQRRLWAPQAQAQQPSRRINVLLTVYKAPENASDIAVEMYDNASCSTRILVFTATEVKYILNWIDSCYWEAGDGKKRNTARYYRHQMRQHRAQNPYKAVTVDEIAARENAKKAMQQLWPNRDPRSQAKALFRPITLKGMFPPEANIRLRARDVLLAQQLVDRIALDIHTGAVTMEGLSFRKVRGHMATMIPRTLWYKDHCHSFFHSAFSTTTPLRGRCPSRGALIFQDSIRVNSIVGASGADKALRRGLSGSQPRGSSGATVLPRCSGRGADGLPTASILSPSSASAPDTTEAAAAAATAPRGYGGLRGLQAAGGDVVVTSRVMNGSHRIIAPRGASGEEQKELLQHVERKALLRTLASSGGLSPNITGDVYGGLHGACRSYGVLAHCKVYEQYGDLQFELFVPAHDTTYRLRVLYEELADLFQKESADMFRLYKSCIRSCSFPPAFVRRILSRLQLVTTSAHPLNDPSFTAAVASAAASVKEGLPVPGTNNPSPRAGPTEKAANRQMKTAIARLKNKEERFRQAVKVSRLRRPGTDTVLVGSAMLLVMNLDAPSDYIYKSLPDGQALYAALFRNWPSIRRYLALPASELATVLEPLMSRRASLEVLQSLSVMLRHPLWPKGKEVAWSQTIGCIALFVQGFYASHSTDAAATAVQTTPPFNGVTTAAAAAAITPAALLGAPPPHLRDDSDVKQLPPSAQFALPDDAPEELFSLTEAEDGKGSLAVKEQNRLAKYRLREIAGSDGAFRLIMAKDTTSTMSRVYTAVRRLKGILFEVSIYVGPEGEALIVLYEPRLSKTVRLELGSEDVLLVMKELRQLKSNDSNARKTSTPPGPPSLPPSAEPQPPMPSTTPATPPSCARAVFSSAWWKRERATAASSGPSAVSVTGSITARTQTKMALPPPSMPTKTPLHAALPPRKGKSLHHSTVPASQGWITSSNGRQVQAIRVGGFAVRPTARASKDPRDHGAVPGATKPLHFDAPPSTRDWEMLCDYLDLDLKPLRTTAVARRLSVLVTSHYRSPANQYQFSLLAKAFEASAEMADTYVYRSSMQPMKPASPSPSFEDAASPMPDREESEAPGSNINVMEVMRPLIAIDKQEAKWVSREERKRRAKEEAKEKHKKQSMGASGDGKRKRKVIRRKRHHRSDDAKESSPVPSVTGGIDDEGEDTTAAASTEQKAPQVQQTTRGSAKAPPNRKANAGLAKQVNRAALLAKFEEEEERRIKRSRVHEKFSVLETEQHNTRVSVAPARGIEFVLAPRHAKRRLLAHGAVGAVEEVTFHQPNVLPQSASEYAHLFDGIDGQAAAVQHAVLTHYRLPRVVGNWVWMQRGAWRPRPDGDQAVSTLIADRSQSGSLYATRVKHEERVQLALKSPEADPNLEEWRVVYEGWRQVTSLNNRDRSLGLWLRVQVRESNGQLWVRARRETTEEREMRTTVEEQRRMWNEDVASAAAESSRLDQEYNKRRQLAYDAIQDLQRSVESSVVLQGFPNGFNPRLHFTFPLRFWLFPRDVTAEVWRGRVTIGGIYMRLRIGVTVQVTNNDAVTPSLNADQHRANWQHTAFVVSASMVGSLEDSESEKLNSFQDVIPGMQVWQTLQQWVKVWDLVRHRMASFFPGAMADKLQPTTSTAPTPSSASVVGILLQGLFLVRSGPAKYQLQWLPPLTPGLELIQGARTPNQRDAHASVHKSPAINPQHPAEVLAAMLLARFVDGNQIPLPDSFEVWLNTPSSKALVMDVAEALRGCSWFTEGAVAPEAPLTLPTASVAKGVKLGGLYYLVSLRAEGETAVRVSWLLVGNQSELPDVAQYTLPQTGSFMLSNARAASFVPQGSSNYEAGASTILDHLALGFTSQCFQPFLLPAASGTASATPNLTHSKQLLRFGRILKAGLQSCHAVCTLHGEDGGAPISSDVATELLQHCISRRTDGAGHPSLETSQQGLEVGLPGDLGRSINAWANQKEDVTLPRHNSGTLSEHNGNTHEVAGRGAMNAVPRDWWLSVETMRRVWATGQRAWHAAFMPHDPTCQRVAVDVQRAIAMSGLEGGRLVPPAGVWHLTAQEGAWLEDILFEEGAVRHARTQHVAGLHFAEERIAWWQCAVAKGRASEQSPFEMPLLCETPGFHALGTSDRISMTSRPSEATAPWMANTVAAALMEHSDASVAEVAEGHGVMAGTSIPLATAAAPSFSFSPPRSFKVVFQGRVSFQGRAHYARAIVLTSQDVEFMTRLHLGTALQGNALESSEAGNNEAAGSSASPHTGAPTPPLVMQGTPLPGVAFACDPEGTTLWRPLAVELFDPSSGAVHCMVVSLATPGVGGHHKDLAAQIQAILASRVNAEALLPAVQLDAATQFHPLSVFSITAAAAARVKATRDMEAEDRLSRAAELRSAAALAERMARLEAFERTQYMPERLSWGAVKAFIAVRRRVAQDAAAIAAAKVVVPSGNAKAVNPQGTAVVSYGYAARDEVQHGFPQPAAPTSTPTQSPRQGAAASGLGAALMKKKGWGAVRSQVVRKGHSVDSLEAAHAGTCEAPTAAVETHVCGQRQALSASPSPQEAPAGAAPNPFRCFNPREHQARRPSHGAAAASLPASDFKQSCFVPLHTAPQFQFIVLQAASGPAAKCLGLGCSPLPRAA